MGCLLVLYSGLEHVRPLTLLADVAYWINLPYKTANWSFIILLSSQLYAFYFSKATYYALLLVLRYRQPVTKFMRVSDKFGLIFSTIDDANSRHHVDNRSNNTLKIKPTKTILNIQYLSLSIDDFSTSTKIQPNSLAYQWCINHYNIYITTQSTN